MVTTAIRMDLGRANYEMYKKTVERKHAPGLTLVPWEALDRAGQLGWAYGAVAVLEAVRSGELPWP